MDRRSVVAIIGRPNVGKSTLFNRLVSGRVSIVHDSPGVTRDYVCAECEWNGRIVDLIDSGGLDVMSEEFLVSKIRSQVESLINSADVLIFVVDVKSGLLRTDEEIVENLKRSGKPVVLCVNKCDECGFNADIYEFCSLGFGVPVAVSSIHGHGTGDLLDKVFGLLPQVCDVDEEFIEQINVAIIGRPNVGKSSLMNKLCGKERSIVADFWGTTRDSLDVDVVITLQDGDKKRFNFIDTAGIRRNRCARDDIEEYSVMRSMKAVERADVCVLLLDAYENIVEQDVKIAGITKNLNKPCIILINKWDKVSEKEKETLKFTEKIKKDFSFMEYAPFLFISAFTGQRVEKIFGVVSHVFRSFSLRISTGLLNEFLGDVMLRNPPPRISGKQLRIYYMTQVSSKPPVFVFFVNKFKLFHFSYQRHIENRIRQVFDFTGTPIRFLIREKNEKYVRRNLDV
ncbi:MAG: ribosome biogenesis GTPase Der [Oscillospiraceae bacterium]|jgi:GTP-binding protein|nr:ribosome biogenesis GTPase Der [Oscillospiraceae bacterium]